MPASFYLTAVRNGVTIAEASVSLLDAVTIDEWLSSLGVPDDDSSTDLKGWMVSAVAGDVTDVIVQGDCAVSQLMTEAVDAGLANFGDNIVITAVYEESSGGGGSVSDTAKKYVDPAAAQELVKKTEGIVNARVPAPSTSDSGKFLTVNSSGSAEWTTVPSASGVSF